MAIKWHKIDYIKQKGFPHVNGKKYLAYFQRHDYFAIVEFDNDAPTPEFWLVEKQGGTCHPEFWAELEKPV